MTLRHYSSDAKEVNILIVVDCFKIGVKLGVFNIAIYGITVRCFFNSFEQCMITLCIMANCISYSGVAQHVLKLTCIMFC